MEFASVQAVEPVQMKPGIIRRSLVHKDRILLVHWEIKGDTWFGEHSHPYEQGGFVTRGSLEFFVSGRKHTLRPGSAYVVASGVKHDAHALEDCEIIDVFSPVRPEYLPPGERV